MGLLDWLKGNKKEETKTEIVEPVAFLWIFFIS